MKVDDLEDPETALRNEAAWLAKLLSNQNEEDMRTVLFVALTHAYDRGMKDVLGALTPTQIEKLLPVVVN